MATLHALEVFITVYRTRNITAAAHQFYCSQPSISRIIKDLEEEYSVTLFERFHHKLIPTAQADTLYEHSTRMIEDYNSLNTSMKNSESVLRIGSTVTISNTVLTDYISQFQKTQKDVRIEVTVNNGASLQKALLDNTLDFAFIEDSIHYSDLSSIQFGHDRLVLLVPENHPLANKEEVTLSDIQGMTFLHRDSGSAVREYLDKLFAEKNIQVDTLWQSTSTHALIHAVEKGIGITILPYNMCLDEITRKRVIPVFSKDNLLERNYYVVYHSQKIMTAVMKNFLNLILQ